MLDKLVKILIVPKINLIKMLEDIEEVPLKYAEAPYVLDAQYGRALLAQLREATARECGVARLGGEPADDEVASHPEEN